MKQLRILFVLIALMGFVDCSLAQLSGVAVATDTDRDGLSDQVEAQLLNKFAPEFMISRNDCSVRPAAFFAGIKNPTVSADDGTIYGQAFPRKGVRNEVELHYYHLWPRDCGEMGHRLDAEHVSALIEMGKRAGDARAIDWYAAAHEDTVCDASHLARAATIHAEDHGATIWVSEGKHASFLSEAMCRHGCGGDRCADMKPLHIRQIINLGELYAPMNGIVWLASPEWPLSEKLNRTDFSETRLARVERLPATDIVWANPGKRPAQAAILGANAGVGGAAVGLKATDAALDVADENTSAALDTGAVKTDNALKKSSRAVWKALKKSAKATGRVLDGKKE